jgi:hypothetical protein
MKTYAIDLRIFKRDGPRAEQRWHSLVHLMTISPWQWSRQAVWPQNGFVTNLLPGYLRHWWQEFFHRRPITVGTSITTRFAAPSGSFGIEASLFLGQAGTTLNTTRAWRRPRCVARCQAEIVSDRLNSCQIACLCGRSRQSASRATASGLPASARSVKTG